MQFRKRTAFAGFRRRIRGSETAAMTSSRQSGTNYGRRFMWLLLGIILVICFYTAGWFYAARTVVDQVQGAIVALNGDGRRASCEEPQARGYPFRIGIFCRSVMFEDAGKGVAFRAGELRSAAQVYQPWRIIGELDGPASLEAPGLNALSLGWSALRASARLASPLPERVSVEATDLAVQLDEQGETLQPLARSDSAELHLRPVGDDLDVAVRFAGLALDEGVVGAVPPLSGLIDFSLAGGALPGGSEGGLRGHSGVIRALAVSAENGAGVTVSGPVAVDEAGLIDAELSVSVREPAALAKILGDLAPHARREIELALSAMAGANARGLPLNIVRGEARLGFIPLGNIPPL